MLNDNDKSTLFLDEINTEAQKRCENIKKDIDCYVASELKKARELAQANVGAVKKDETDRLTERNNASLSELEAEETHRLFERRNEIANDVFNKASDKIKAFVSGNDYLTFLKKSITSLKSAIGDDAVIFLRPDDKKFENELKELCSEIGYDASIILGGCKAENLSASLVADDTLDSRFEEAKNNFYSTSGLTISL